MQAMQVANDIAPTDVQGAYRMQALGMLDQPNQSYTEALIRKQLPEASSPAHAASPAAKMGQAEVSHVGTTKQPTNKIDLPPADLTVRCTVDSRGAAAHVTWTAAFESWPSFVSMSELSYEVQMIVRWISDQEWNTIYTVSGTNCTVEGLKPSYPFAVRVKAVSRHWMSDYTAPFEFVTEQSQTTEEVLSAVAADVQKSKAQNRRAEAKLSTSDTPLQGTTYLERLMQIRRERAERDERIRTAQRHAPPVTQAPQQAVPSADGLHAPPQATQPMSSHMMPRNNEPTASNNTEYAKEERRPVQSVTHGGINNEQQRQAPANGGPTVRRITLDNPENPHHEMVKKHYANHFRRDVVIASGIEAPMVSGPSPSLVPTPSNMASDGKRSMPQGTQEPENIYGSIYQAMRHVPRTAAVPSTSTQAPFEIYGSNRQTAHLTPLTYNSVIPERPSTMATSGIGPLAKALGVSEYAPREEVMKLSLATRVPTEAPRRIVSQDNTSVSATGLRVARAVRVGTAEDGRAGQNSSSLSGSVASRRSVI